MAHYTNPESQMREWSSSGVVIGRENKTAGKKVSPVPLYPPKIP
jgi:hypothetical protein